MAGVALVAGLALSTIQTIKSADQQGQEQKTLDQEQKQEQDLVSQDQAQQANQANTNQNNSNRDAELAQQRALAAAYQGQNGTLLTGPMGGGTPPGTSSNQPLGYAGTGTTLLGS